MTKRLVLGIDPAPGEIPDVYKLNGEVDFLNWGKDLILTCQSHIGGVKFQSAYFEAYGIMGVSALSTLMADAKNHDLTVIMDAKRGDIGATSKAYATAYLATQNDGYHSDFESDYLTVNPLMGEDCIQPFVDAAVTYGKGIFVLLETSNPGANMILKRPLDQHRCVNDVIAEYIQSEHDKMGVLPGQFGPIGCVIGATHSDVSHWRKKLPNSLFLMPGIGAQGGSWHAVKQCLDKNGEGVLVPISRGITSVQSSVSSKEEYLDTVLSQLMVHVKHMMQSIG